MLLNNELSITIPDSFHILSAEEMAGFRFIAEGPGIAASDPEKHVILSIGWKQLGLFTGFILNTNDIARNMEKQISSAMNPFGYTSGGKIEKHIGGETAKEIRFRYTAGDAVEMTGASCVVKHRSTLYYFHFYTRRETEAETEKLWDEILGSASWTKC